MRTRTDRILFWVGFAAATVGLLVSIYMTIYKLTNNNAMCLGSGGCSYVNASRYSEVGGFPVAGIGVIGFLAIMVVTLLEMRSHFFTENGPLLEFGMSLLGVLYSIFLTYLELYVINYICPFCVTSALAILAVFIVSTIRLIRQFRAA
jgi:uncharacterized membrane protein